MVVLAEEEPAHNEICCNEIEANSKPNKKLVKNIKKEQIKRNLAFGPLDPKLLLREVAAGLKRSISFGRKKSESLRFSQSSSVISPAVFK